MFDLPTDTSMDRRHYRRFRKFLIDEGFVMMQESIYTKICINGHAISRVEAAIKKNRPPKGLVQMMIVTERQFSGMELISGDVDNSYIQSDERMIVL